MSHTTEINDTIFIHNGSYEGNVEIIVEGEVRKESIQVPFEDLKEFVANYARDRIVERLEQSSADEILNWEW